MGGTSPLRIGQRVKSLLEKAMEGAVWAILTGPPLRGEGGRDRLEDDLSGDDLGPVVRGRGRLACPQRQDEGECGQSEKERSRESHDGVSFEVVVPTGSLCRPGIFLDGRGREYVKGLADEGHRLSPSPGSVFTDRRRAVSEPAVGRDPSPPRLRRKPRSLRLQESGDIVASTPTPQTTCPWSLE
jgi:hypothetical protein